MPAKRKMPDRMNEPRLGQNPQRRYEIAEDVLRTNIAEGTLPPGLVLLEGPIADILQISRAPVQRALLQLESDGLVHRFKGRGYLVGPPGRAIEPNRTDIKTLGLIVPQHADEALQSRSSWERIYDEIENDVAGCVIFGQYRIIENVLRPLGAVLPACRHRHGHAGYRPLADARRGKLGGGWPADDQGA